MVILPPWNIHYLKSNQRIDVVARVGKTAIAFEYQCAPISLEEFETRTTGIRQAGFVPIWIFGERYLKSLYNHSFRLSPLLKSAIMKEPPFNQPILLFYSTSKKRLTLLSQFYSSHLRSFVQRTHRSLRQVGLETFQSLPTNIPWNRFKSYWLKEKQQLRSKQQSTLQKSTRSSCRCYIKSIFILNTSQPVCTYRSNQITVYLFLITFGKHNSY